jgi:hypothetical protein
MPHLSAVRAIRSTPTGAPSAPPAPTATNRISRRAVRDHAHPTRRHHQRRPHPRLQPRRTPAPARENRSGRTNQQNSATTYPACPRDLQTSNVAPTWRNAALGPPLSKPSQTLIHVQASKSAFNTGHFHPRCRPIPSALRAAHSWIGTCFSAHASTTAATMSWVRRVSRSSTVTEPLSVRC